jgi:hypothetical protein
MSTAIEAAGDTATVEIATLLFMPLQSVACRTSIVRFCVAVLINFHRVRLSLSADDSRSSYAMPSGFRRIALASGRVIRASRRNLQHSTSDASSINSSSHCAAFIRLHHSELNSARGASPTASADSTPSLASKNSRPGNAATTPAVSCPPTGHSKVGILRAILPRNSWVVCASRHSYASPYGDS